MIPIHIGRIRRIVRAGMTGGLRNLFIRYADFVRTTQIRLITIIRETFGNVRINNLLDGYEGEQTR